MTQQIYTTPTPFNGKDVTIENTGRGYTSNMVIKGQTYQNLFTGETILKYNSDFINNSIISKANPTTSFYPSIAFKTPLVTSGMKYTLMCDLKKILLMPRYIWEGKKIPILKL